MTDMGNRIRDLRRQIGFSQRELAEFLGVTYVTISRWESSRVQPNRLALRALSSLVQNMHDGGPRMMTGNPPGAAEFKPSDFSSTLPAQNQLVVDKRDHLLKGNEGLEVLSRENKVAEILKKSKVFSVLNRQQSIGFSEIAAERVLRSGQFLYREGDIVQHFYVVAEGRVKIFMNSPSGVDFVMGFSSPGGMIGNIALISGKPHSSSAQAMIDSRILEIKNSDFLSFISRDPELGFKIFRRMLINFSIRLTNLMRRITDMAVETAEYRVAYVLVRLFWDFGSTLPFTREEIGQMAGIATETAVRTLNRFRSTGVIGTFRHKIIILDPMKLQEILKTAHRK